MNHASGAVAPPDAEVVQVGDAIWQRAERPGLACHGTSCENGPGPGAGPDRLGGLQDSAAFDGVEAQGQLP